MAYVQVNQANTTDGNMTVNTLTTEQYIADGWGKVGRQHDEHDHASGKGLAVKRVQSGTNASRPAAGNAGTVYIATDAPKAMYYDDGVGWHQEAVLDAAQTWTAAQTESANHIFNALWSDAARVTVASAAAFPLPTTSNNVTVTGTTGITSFTGPATQGVTYRLQFTDAAPGTVTSGGNVKLNGTFSPAQNNILYLYWDGTNAYEIFKYTGTFIPLLLNFGSDSTGLNLSNVTTYIGPAGSGSEISQQVPMCQPVTITKLYVNVAAAPVGAQTFAFTLRKNGADTTITCTITGAAVQASDTAHSVSFVAGDLYTIKAVGSATAANSSACHGQLST